MTKRIMTLVMGLILILAVSTMAATIHVPADQSTIQAGISAAVDGDTVLVAAGVYVENLAITNSITLLSEGGAPTTRLTPSSQGISLVSASDVTLTVEGFTFRDCTAWKALDFDRCDLRFRSNVVTSNTSGIAPMYVRGVWDTFEGKCIVESCDFYDNQGGSQSAALCVIDIANPSVVEGCRFWNNTGDHGGGITLWSVKNAKVFRNLIHHNIVTGYGGGIACVNTSDNDSLINNTVVHNQCGIDGGGIYSVDIARCNIVAFNQGGAVGGISGGVATTERDYNDVFQNLPLDYDNSSGPGAHSISADPLFRNAPPNLFSLADNSPCIDAGDPNPVYNDPDGSRNDMGAFPYVAPNERPTITQISDQTKYEGDTLSFLVTATDPDSTIPTLIAQNLPLNAATFTDSGNGNGSFYWPIAAKQSGVFDIMFVASDSVLADTVTVVIAVLPRLPELGQVFVEQAFPNDHVLDHTPQFDWQYLDFGDDDPQLKFEIAVGTDSDWTYAEMWNPAPFSSADTFVVYNGAPLVDGATYWLRLRVNNALAWSDWKQIAFRMNSIPTVPQLRLPLPGAQVAVHQPELVIRNSNDAENDSLLYYFEVSPDNFLTTVFTFTKKQSPDSLTALIVDSVLTENAQYWWRVKASDYYEQSDFSEIRSFWVNGENTLPSSFDLILPPDTSGAPLTTLLPYFVWSPSSDPDPLDGVRYSLNIALDANFNFVNTIDALTENAYTLTADDSLSWGTRYWWKVRAYDYHGGNTWSTQVLTFRTITLGDANNDGEVDISDAVYLIAYIFSGGPAPSIAGDANCDHTIDISDAVYLIAFIFSGGAAPCAAF